MHKPAVLLGSHSAEAYCWAAEFVTMEDCYGALLNGEAGYNNLEYALVCFYSKAFKRDKIRFAIDCTKRIPNSLIKNIKLLAAIQMAKLYCSGVVGDEALMSSLELVRDVMDTVKMDSIEADVITVASATVNPIRLLSASDAMMQIASTIEEEKQAQMKFLQSVGNIFSAEYMENKR